MQRLAFPLRGRPDDEVTPDGYHINSLWPQIADEQVVLAVLREPNTKHQWNVYTRVFEPQHKRYRYDDGLEFRHREDLAREEFKRRIKRLELRSKR